jgi:DNA adenine methylase
MNFEENTIHKNASRPFGYYVINKDDSVISEFSDGPYDCTFKDYGNNNNFNNNEQKELADNFKKLKCKALMIIGKTELIENLYKGGYIKAEYDKQYSVNVKNRMKDINSVKHLIIANY